MHSSATDRYLETQILTAPPQKLHLMLIEAAIRSAERAKRHLEAEQFAEACETLIHAQQIVTEMLGGMNRDADAPLTRKVAAVYLFVFRSLAEANLHRDPRKLDDALRVLQVERETWQQLCAKPVGQPAPTIASDPPSAANPPQIPNLPAAPHVADETSSGFSLEA